nr:MAG TPA: hypothetical protein [Inoviridae sp.]
MYHLLFPSKDCKHFFKNFFQRIITSNLKYSCGAPHNLKAKTKIGAGTF